MIRLQTQVFKCVLKAVKRGNSPTMWLWQTGSVVNDSWVQLYITFSCWNKTITVDTQRVRIRRLFLSSQRHNSCNKPFLIFLCGAFTLKIRTFAPSPRRVTLSHTKCSVSMFLSLQQHLDVFPKIQLIHDVSLLPLLSYLTVQERLCLIFLFPVITGK